MTWDGNERRNTKEMENILTEIRAMRTEIVELTLKINTMNITAEERHKRDKEADARIFARLESHEMMVDGNGNGWPGCRILLNQFRDFRAGLTAHFWALWTAILSVAGAIVAFYLTRNG